MSKYSTMPWYSTRVFKNSPNCYVATIYNDKTREGNGIARVTATTEAECEANAKLIAQAPALIAALMRSRNWTGAGGEWQDASGRRIEVEQEVNRQASEAIDAAKS